MKHLATKNTKYGKRYLVERDDKVQVWLSIPTDDEPNMTNFATFDNIHDAKGFLEVVQILYTKNAVVIPEAGRFHVRDSVSLSPLAIRNLQDIILAFTIGRRTSKEDNK